MILTTDEITWVIDKLNTYGIKYQEIYDELKDHLLTAIENLREAGDDRSVEMLFDEVVKQQFPGYWPFEDILKQYQVAYRHKIGKAMWANMQYYCNWQTAPLIVLLLVIGFYLPHTKPVMGSLLVSLLLMAVIPLVYTYRNGRRISTGKGRQSLIKGYVFNQANLLMIIINLLLNGIGALSRQWDAAAFLNPMHYHPVVYMLLFSFFIIYGLSCIRLCRQEFKIA
ncbi:MAG: hypothetical protein V4592_20105 [Bacteroidota bacterium]